MAGSYNAEYARDDGNQVTVTYDLYDDGTFRRETAVTRVTRPLMVRSTQHGDEREVLSRTVVTGTWRLAPGKDADAGGTVQLQVTGCDGDACGSEVDVGDTLRLSYAVGDDGAVDLDVAPATREPSDRSSANVPLKPAALSAVGGDGQVTLSWRSAGEGIKRWEYRQSTDGATTWTDWLEIAGSGAETKSYTVTGLTNGTAHAFQIRARNAHGNGPASDTATATPASLPTVTRQIPEQRVSMGHPETVDLSAYIAGATSYSAVSSDAGELRVSSDGSVLTLTPVSLTAKSDPVVVTVTASKGADELEVTFSVHVVRPVVTLDCVANDYYEADLSGADLSGQAHTGCEMYGVNLAGADLSGTTLSDSNLYEADLSNADLTGADLSGPDPYVKKVVGTDLRRLRI